MTNKPSEMDVAKSGWMRWDWMGISEWGEKRSGNILFLAEWGDIPLQILSDFRSDSKKFSWSCF